MIIIKIKLYKNNNLNINKKNLKNKMIFKLELKSRYQIFIQMKNQQINNFNQYLCNKQNKNKDKYLKMNNNLQKENILIH